MTGITLPPILARDYARTILSRILLGVSLTFLAVVILTAAIVLE